ncbi:hypothetical protein ASC96_17540 [Rhizobium sp. Root1204]|nr:hypothetical protein ASC96_17540 [Rhizobium sp. Root1204]
MPRDEFSKSFQQGFVAINHRRLAADRDVDANLSVGGSPCVDTCRDSFIGSGDLEGVGVRLIILRQRGPCARLDALGGDFVGDMLTSPVIEGCVFELLTNLATSILGIDLHQIGTHRFNDVFSAEITGLDGSYSGLHGHLRAKPSIFVMKTTAATPIFLRRARRAPP